MSGSLCMVFGEDDMRDDRNWDSHDACPMIGGK